mgnify:FL=1
MKKQLEKVLKQYIKEFEKKQDLTFEFAVDDNLMTSIFFENGIHFYMTDIIYDIDNNIEKGLIDKWVEYVLINESCINYRTYLKMIL